MGKVEFGFKGLMAPTFTAFKDDKKRTVNYDSIDSYAKYLKEKNVHGVLINGTTGEGTTLRVDERKKVAEEWLKASRKYKITCVIQIGGGAVGDVCDLAEHAEKIGVDAVMTLPDLFFRPKTEEALVEYMRTIAEYCPSTPLLYYHIPMFTGVTLSMPRFYDLAEKQVPNFCGLKFTSNDLDEGSAILKEGRNVYLGADTILCGAFSLGFESAILTTLNICPEIAHEMYTSIRNNNVNEAKAAQDKLNKRIRTICPRGADWVETMKVEFNRQSHGLQAGPARKPKVNF